MEHALEVDGVTYIRGGRAIGYVDPRHDLRSNLSAERSVLTGVTSTLEEVPHWTPGDAEIERAQSLVKLLGLDAKPVHWFTMSQGERGRALIARALMTEPELLLREGRIVAAGDVDEVLTSELVSETFAHPIKVARRDGRWSAVAG